MITAINLLVSAQILINLVLSNPNLPQEFVNNAIAIANNAIKVAQEELVKVPEPTQPVQQIINNPIVATTTQTTPVLGAVTQPPMAEPQVIKGLKISGISDGRIYVQYTENGNPVSGKVVTLSSNNGGEIRTPVWRPDEEDRTGLGSNQSKTRMRPEAGGGIGFRDNTTAFFTFKKANESDIVTLTANVDGLEATYLLD